LQKWKDKLRCYRRVWPGGNGGTRWGGRDGALLKEQAGGILKDLGDELKSMAQGVADTSNKLMESAMSYRDALARPLQQGQAQYMAQSPHGVSPMYQGQEGIRARQVLVDVRDMEEKEVVRCESVQRSRIGPTRHWGKVAEIWQDICSGCH